MRWRLRLYCGHVVERTAHVDHRTIHAAFASGIVCPECGLDPATIVAGRALGAAASPPPPQAAAGKSPKRARTGSLERRLARAMAEVAGLEAELDHES
jgi:hypothetical protein